MSYIEIIIKPALKALGLSAIYVFAVIPLQANADVKFDPFKAAFSEISPGIWTSIRPQAHLHPVMGNSVFVISEQGVIVYDGGGLAIMADKLIAKIRSLTKAPVTHVIISHWHGDHNFGIYRFREEFPNVEFVTQQFTDRALHSQKMAYLDKYPNYLTETIPRIEKLLAETQWDENDIASQSLKEEYKRILAYKDIVAPEFKRAKLTQATVVFEKQLTIKQGQREVQLLLLGPGNTEGDIVMWLPKEKIVATGDLVVHPTPYAFNVPPRAWAKTLTALNALDYTLLVPGHGKVQDDTAYVDLLIEVATYVADQRDDLLTKGLATEQISEKIDLSQYQSRFIGEDKSLSNFYKGYFTDPLLAAAIKELSGQPMVELVPKE
jgi:cyclase